MTHKLVVASTNPVKIGAALAGFQRMFPDQTYEARGVAARSGVSDQPMSDRETLQGALNRVEDARRLAPDADYWIGLEGGVERVGTSLEAFAWIVVSDGHRIGRARTASYFLSDETARLIDQGMELGHADDIIFGRANSKQQNGSVGLLTGDVITRTIYYEHAVILALIPFKNPQLSFNASNL
jgi:inosine/xanthosine triphosphatase